MTYVWKIWNPDDTFEELHLPGSVEELREAAEEIANHSGALKHNADRPLTLINTV